MQIWTFKNGIILLALGGSIAAASYLALKTFYRCRRRQRHLEQLVDDLHDVIESLNQDIGMLSERVSALELHTRSNTTALRAFNTSTKLHLYRCAEMISRLQGHRSASLDDTIIGHELRITPLVNIEQRSPQSNPDGISPSRRLESRFRTLCHDWSVEEAAARTLQEFQQSELVPDTAHGAAELRLEALISLQTISVQKKNA